MNEAETTVGSPERQNGGTSPTVHTPADALVHKTSTLLTWAAATLGAITAILGTFGCLATNAHNAMLGFDTDSTQNFGFIIRGAWFIVSVGYRAIVKPQFDSQAWVAITGVLFLILSYQLHLKVPKIRLLLRYSGLTFIVWSQGWAIQQSEQLQEYGNFLLAGVPNRPLFTMIVHSPALAADYFGRIALVTLISTTAVLCWQQSEFGSVRNAREQLFYSLSTIIAAVFTIGSVLSLSISYGILMISNFYPRVRLIVPSKESEIKGLSKLSMRGALFLIGQDDSKFTFYNSERPGLVGVRRDSVDQVTLFGHFNILREMPLYDYYKCQFSPDGYWTSPHPIQSYSGMNSISIYSEDPRTRLDVDIKEFGSQRAVWSGKSVGSVVKPLKQGTFTVTVRRILGEGDCSVKVVRLSSQ